MPRAVRPDPPVAAAPGAGDAGRPGARHGRAMVARPRRWACRWSGSAPTASRAPREPDPRRAYVAAKATLALDGGAADQAAAPADPALGRLALRPRGGLPGPLPVLLPRGLASGTAGDPRLRQPRRDPGQPRGLCRARRRHLGLGRARRRRAPRSRPPATPIPSASSTSPASLSAAIRHFGAWDAPVQLRFTTKFAAVAPLLDLPHNRRTRIRFSVNARAAAHYEGGTDPARRAARRAGRRRPGPATRSA